MLGKEYFYIDKEKYENKPIIKNLGIEESLYNSDKSDYFPKYKSPSLLVEEENLKNEEWELYENNVFKNKKFTTYRKLIKKQVKKQLFFGRYSFTYWGEKIYKYRIRQYVPNRLPINCLDFILITEKEKYENKPIPFNYLDKSEWKEHLKSYLKKFHESVDGEELLTFENSKDIENLKWELENTREFSQDRKLEEKNFSPSPLAGNALASAKKIYPDGKVIYLVSLKEKQSQLPITTCLYAKNFKEYENEKKLMEALLPGVETKFHGNYVRIGNTIFENLISNWEAWYKEGTN